MTALDLISSSLRLVNVLASGESATLSEANDSLAAFNQMIDSWNTSRLSIFTTRSDDFPFVIGQQAYTVGTGGNFNMARPARIDSMSAILLTNPANPVEQPIDMYTVEEWQTQVPVKNVPSSFPLVCYDDGGFPLRTLNFWPIPQQANDVRIYSWQALSEPATLATAITFPPGYPEAFRFNLAIRLAAEFSVAVPPAVQAIATESLARLKTMNAPELKLRSDLLATNGGYNYRADMFGLPY
jgi:hypothetical protein